MARVSISLGSNINRERNIRLAVEALRKSFGAINISPVYETAAVGFSGEDFLNLVVCFDSDISVEQLVRDLKTIEDDIGRDRSLPKFSARTIDLDLLTYDDRVIDDNGIQIPRHEILQNAFVLKPLSDLMGQDIHPMEAKTYHQLWQEMATHADRIELFDLDLS